jgi:hypothetical protein
MTTETCNGFANWETWNTALWIDNDYAMYRARLAYCRTWTAEKVEAFVKSVMPNGTPDMDTTDDGYPAVDWDEIAEHWNAD